VFLKNMLWEEDSVSDAIIENMDFKRTNKHQNTTCQALLMCFWSVASEPATCTAPGSLLEMQTFRFHLRLAGSENLAEVQVI
jgi:hypothetical protein